MNVGTWIDRWAKYTPEAIALVDDTSGRRLPYAEFANRIERLSGALYQRLHLRRGDRLGVLAYNCAEVLELFFAVARLGAVLVPINYRLAAPEMAYVVQNAGVSALFCGAEFLALG